MKESHGQYKIFFHMNLENIISKSIKKNEGGGLFAIIKNGVVFDSVGINFSEVSGKFHKTLSLCSSFAVLYVGIHFFLSNSFLV